MTDLEKSEFLKISQENEDFKKVVKSLVRLYNYLRDTLGIDLSTIQSMDDITSIIPEVMFKWNTGEISFDRMLQDLSDLKDVLPMAEKYKDLIN